MRTLVIVVLLATLIGCSCPAPKMVSEWCTSRACLDRIGPPVALKPASLRPNPPKAKVSSRVAKTSKPSPQPGRNGADPAKEEKTHLPVAVTPEASTPDKPPETPDAVLKKAKATIAAKMEDPASAEFTDLSRAFRENALGKSVDTICGRVKGKKASGEETAERPFLYVVKDDQAYIVDGNRDSVAATVYRTICTGSELHGKNTSPKTDQ